MTDEQITALAREYAEEKGKEMEQKHSLPNCLIKEVMEMDVKELTRFLKWLLRRYCLVEKSKAREARALALDSHLKDSHLTDEGQNTYLISYSFPKSQRRWRNDTES